MSEVNEQITDSVTQVNTKNLAEVPAIAMGGLLMATNTAMGNASHNAALSQQQGQMLMMATVTQGVNAINAIAAASISKAAKNIING